MYRRGSNQFFSKRVQVFRLKLVFILQPFRNTVAVILKTAIYIKWPSLNIMKVKNAWTLIKCFKIYQKHFIGVKYSFIMIFEKFKIILIFLDWVFIFYRKDCCLQNQRTVLLHGRKTMFLLKKLIASYYIILDNLLTIQ